MKDPKADEVLRIRLKYDWLVLLYGLFVCVVQLVYPREIDDFLIILAFFAFVEVFNVSTYRNLKKGGDGFITMVGVTLNQDASFLWIIACILLDFFIILIFSLVFFIKQPV